MMTYRVEGLVTGPTLELMLFEPNNVLTALSCARVPLVALKNAHYPELELTAAARQFSALAPLTAEALLAMIKDEVINALAASALTAPSPTS